MRQQPSAYEAQCVAEMRRQCVITAASIWGLHCIGMRTEDAQQHLALAVVAACRTWAEEHVDKPPTAFLRWAIRCRKLKLWRSIRVAIEHGEGGWKLHAGSDTAADNEPSEPMVPDSTYCPEALTSGLERQSNAAGWEAVLHHRLSPTEFALLRLRAEGFTNREIEELGDLSTGDNQGVRRRYYDVKRKAADFLRSCGIQSSESALEACSEDRDAAWKKAIKQGAPK